MPDWRSYIRPHLTALRLPPVRENEIIDELAQHLDDRWRELTAGGATEQEALRLALAQLRDDTLMRNLASLRQSQQPPPVTPFASTGHWVSDLWRDIRYGVRMFRRRPSLMAAAVMALAVGIGVNTTIFTVYRSLIARPVDARDPARVANFALVRASGPPAPTFRAPDYATYRDSVPAFSGLVAFSLDRLTLSNTGLGPTGSTDQAVQRRRLGLLSSGGGNAEHASAAVVSENYFTVMGVTVIAGRAFDSMTRDELAADPVVLVSENYWQKRFGGDPAIVGRTVYLNGAPFKVAGITPHDFTGTGVAVPAFWLPLSLEPLVHPADNWLADDARACCRLFGRLAADATFEQAAAQVTTVARRIDEQSARTNRVDAPPSAIVWRASPFPLPLERYGGLRLSILLTICAGAMVLAVACANVGSLQLARARSREDELRTRLSLGATRTRVIRQLLTESAVVGLVAGTAAFFVTWAMLRIALLWAAGALPVEDGVFVFNVSPDMTVFGYVLGISLAAGLLFGVMPAFESSRAALIGGVRGGTASGRARRFQDLLVIVQVSFSVVLLIAGGVLIRSSMHALGLDPGYDGAHTLDVDVQFPDAGYTDSNKRAVRDELRAKIAAVPGVVAVTTARMPADGSLTTSVSVDGLITGSDRGRPSIRYRYVEPNYFPTLGIPVMRGRVFDSAADGAAHAVVLSRAAATALWPGEDPLGRTLTLGAIDERLHPVGESAPTSVHQVIGVVGDTRGTTFDGSDALQIYLPLSDERPLDRPFLVRVKSAPAAVAADINAAIAGTDPDLVATISVIADILHLSPPVFVSGVSAVVASSVGVIGLLLALMGIHGTVSHIVVLRTREVGIRLAIGAQHRDILSLVVRESFRPVIRGLVVGVSAAVLLSYALRSLLFGLGLADAGMFAIVSTLFLLIAFVAAYMPSRRALRVDPVVALRAE